MACLYPSDVIVNQSKDCIGCIWSCDECMVKSSSLVVEDCLYRDIWLTLHWIYDNPCLTCPSSLCNQFHELLEHQVCSVSCYSLTLCDDNDNVFRRLFVLDCNQERLIDILQNTFDSSLLAIGQKFDVHWPQVLLFSQSMTSSSSSLYQGIELYLSEYLGRVHVLLDLPFPDLFIICL